MQFKHVSTQQLSIKDWQIDASQTWALLGRNGAGKRLVADLICGTTQPTSGQIVAAIEDVVVVSFESQQSLYEEELYLDDTDFMDQLDPGTTVSELLGLENSIPPALAFLGLDRILDRGYRLLSSGESRKTLLAKALLEEPELLILDEPYDGLDKQSRRDLSAFFEDLIERGKQLLFILNSRGDIYPWHSHVAVIEKGEIIAAAEREDILQDKDINALLAFDSESLPPWPEPLYPQDSETPLHTLVKLINASVSYGDTCIFEKLNLTVNRGNHTLVTGPNGSGKSTLLGMITGDHPQCYSNDLEVLGYQRGSGESIWDI